MPIRFQDMIYRKDLQDNPDTLYVFGDNLKRKGMGGQAAEMRYESNAVGVATKKAPGISPADYFRDNEYNTNVLGFRKDLSRAEDHLKAGGEVVFPTNGLGTGLSMLPYTAPQTYQALTDIIAEFVKEYGMVDMSEPEYQPCDECDECDGKCELIFQKEPNIKA